MVAFGILYVSVFQFDIGSRPDCKMIQIIVLWIYRLTLHPLAKYQGPLLAEVSSFHGVYHAYIGDMHTDIERLHQKHGSSLPSLFTNQLSNKSPRTFVRYAPNTLVVGSVEGFHGTSNFIFSKHGGTGFDERV